jgi:hypothetical protein
MFIAIVRCWITKQIEDGKKKALAELFSAFLANTSPNEAAVSSLVASLLANRACLIQLNLQVFSS